MKPLAVFLQLLLVLGLFSPAHAQLAQSFLTVTGITVKSLPNAVQLRIETDGTVQFGGDLRDFIDFSKGFEPKPTQSLRLRLVRARAKLPAFVPLEAYPVDGAVVSLGREEFGAPFFPSGGGDPNDPRVQIDLRFATPVIVRRFAPDNDRDIEFGNYLGPLNLSVELSPDRRAIVVTVITDRADATAPQRLNRSPESARTHSLAVEKLGDERVRVLALHSPLRDVLDAVAEATGLRFLAREDVAALEISLFLPDSSAKEFLAALQNGYGLGFKEEEGVTIMGRSDEFFTARSFTLLNLSPGKARLLFPDFLLPFLRADGSNNALLAVQTPPVVAKIGADLARLDLPRPQFEIRASAWEIASTIDLNAALSLTRSIGRDIQIFDPQTGTASLRVQGGLTDQLNATLRALSARGQARLVASPHVTVVSGERGTLFLGQTRYIKVLQNEFGGQSAQALPLQIGTTLSVTPRGDQNGGDILLDIAPRVSTVDSIEAATGLPTLGIREAASMVRVHSDESVILAGLDLDLEAKSRRKSFSFWPSRAQTREKRTLLVLVSARRVAAALAP